MSAPPVSEVSGPAVTTKDNGKEPEQKQEKNGNSLGDDDEFEDFPVEGKIANLCQ